MFKLVVLSVLIAVAAAKPSLLPAPYVVAPAVTKIVQPAPLLVSSPAHVGSVVSHVPTGISAHSSTVVHHAAPVVTPVVTPVVHKTIVSAPIIRSAPIAYSAPLYHAPLAYSAPALHAPLAYSAPALW